MNGGKLLTYHTFLQDSIQYIIQRTFTLSSHCILRIKSFPSCYRAQDRVHHDTLTEIMTPQSTSLESGNYWLENRNPSSNHGNKEVVMGKAMASINPTFFFLVGMNNLCKVRMKNLSQDNVMLQTPSNNSQKHNYFTSVWMVYFEASFKLVN